MRKVRLFSQHLSLALLTAAGCNMPIETEESDATPESPPQDPGVVWTTPPPREPTPVATPEGDFTTPAPEHVAVRSERELLVSDPAVVRGVEASNALPGAPLSFRTLFSWFVGDERQALIAAREWLGQWQRVTQVGPSAAPVAVRPDVVSTLIAPWFDAPQAAPLGYAGAPVAPDEDEESIWARAPFDLIAVVNRVDLAKSPCSGPAGELRFVFTATTGDGRRPLDMTVIVEVPYPSTRSPAAWANAWHELTRTSEDDYAHALANLAVEVMSDADPLSARLRTNESVLGKSLGLPWEMREFHAAATEHGRRFVMTPLEQTPRADLAFATLAGTVNQQAERVIAGTALLPVELRAGAAQIPEPGFTWKIPGIDVTLGRAFSQQTCNGCHGGDTSALPFQHIAPSRNGGAARLSRFLRDADAPTDELRRRADVYAGLLQAECDAPTPGAGGYATE
jgi:hypothetical protein